MQLATRRVGERLQLGDSLEVVVLEVTSRSVKLGIRGRPRAHPDVDFVSHAPRGRSGYYHSQGGVRMLVVDHHVGRMLRLGESLDLLVEHRHPDGVQFSAPARPR